MLLIIGYFLLITLSNYGFVNPEGGTSRYFAALLLVYSGSYFLLSFKFFTKKTLQIKYYRYLLIFIFIYIVYYILSLVGVHYYSSLDQSRQLRVLFTAIFWMLALINFFEIGFKKSITLKHLKIFSILLYVTSTLVIFSDIFLEIRGGETLNTASGYTSLMVMPLLMYVFKNRLFTILLITIGITLISGKRGALVIEAVLIVFYFFSTKKSHLNKQKNSYITSIILSIFVVAIGYFAFTLSIDSLYDRFMDLFVGTDRGGEIRFGSGRNIFWAYVLLTWWESGFLNNLFGLGFYSTIYTLFDLYGMPIQAHNDYLEMLHNFGLSGLLIFVLFQYHLFLYMKRNYFEKVDKTILGMAFIILVGRGLFAGVLYRPDTLLLAVSIGFIIGDVYRNRILYR